MHHKVTTASYRPRCSKYLIESELSIFVSNKLSFYFYFTEGLSEKRKQRFFQRSHYLPLVPFVRVTAKRARHLVLIRTSLQTTTRLRTDKSGRLALFVDGCVRYLPHVTSPTPSRTLRLVCTRHDKTRSPRGRLFSSFSSLRWT